MRNLGRLPKHKQEEIRGFTPGELNSHFAGISISPLENLKEAMDMALLIIGNFLVRIFNSSFAQGIFPGPCKKTQLIALKKSAAPAFVSDFRPITLLCLPSRPVFVDTKVLRLL